MTIPSHLTDFLATQPSIKCLHRSDADFESTRHVFLETSDIPLLIVRPQTENDVATLIGHLSKTSTAFTIRAGGHDLSTRSTLHDGVQIDLRDISHVRISEDKATALIGGGVLIQDLLDALAPEGLATSVGYAGSIGWPSWAMNGGFGVFSSEFGLGCDQIIGARVVLANGDVVQADDRLLKALRGAGPSFGVVVELQIKVYPLKEITGGVISYTCDDVQSGMLTYLESLRPLISSVKTLPRELYFQPLVMGSEEGPAAFNLLFVWVGSPCDEQSAWLQKLVDLVPSGGTPMVGPTTPSDFVRGMSKMLDSKNVPGGEANAVSLRSLVPSPEAAAIIAKRASLITGTVGGLSIHMLHGTSVSDKEHPPSVFANREVSVMVEILGFAWKDKAFKQEAAEWSRQTFEELRHAEGAYPQSYLPLITKSGFKAENAYLAEELAFLRILKEELDPTNVFANPMELGHQ